MDLQSWTDPAKSYATARVPASKRRYYSPQNFEPSLLSLGALDKYGDEIEPRFFGSARHHSASSISSDYLETYDQIVKQDALKQHVSYYQKDDKKDHHLYGSQFFRTPEHASRNPFNFSNYADFREHSRLLAKDYALVPEFQD